jgi:hypothetical protein
MVQLERFDGHVVAAVDASAAACFDELPFAPPAPLVERSQIRVEPPTTLRLRDSRGVRAANRIFRRVVCPEGRALETKTPSVERSHATVDELLCRERLAAQGAAKRLRGAVNGLSRTTKRTVRNAREAVSPAMDVQRHTVDDDAAGKRRATPLAYLHDADRT